MHWPGVAKWSHLWNSWVPKETQDKAGEKFSAYYEPQKKIEGFPAENSPFACQSKVTEDSGKMPQEKKSHIFELWGDVEQGNLWCTTGCNEEDDIWSVVW